MIEVTQLSKTYPLVCRRLVVPDQRATSGADRHCQSVATHSRAGVDALRLVGSTRSRIARHLGDGQHHRDGHAEHGLLRPVPCFGPASLPPRRGSLIGFHSTVRPHTTDFPDCSIIRKVAVRGSCWVARRSVTVYVRLRDDDANLVARSETSVHW